MVETRQVIKLVEELINAEYPSTAIVSVKANLTHQFRQTFDFPKIREVNDYHHAFDAALTAFIGTYLLKRYPKLERFFVYGKFAKQPVNLTRFNVIRKLAKTDTPITDIDTGEVLWNKLTDIKYFETLYDYKRLLVTREVRKNYGAMFKQTLFKANDARSKTLIPKKNNMKTNVYGGYSSQELAYLTVVRVSHKNGFGFLVVGIPTRLVADIDHYQSQGLTIKQATHKAIESRFTKINRKTGRVTVSDYEVILPKVCLDQVIRDQIKGKKYRFLLGSDQDYHNMQQLYLPLSTQRAFNGHRNESCKQRSDDLMVVYDVVLTQLQQYFPLHTSRNFDQIVKQARESFVALENDPQKDVKQFGKREILNSLFIGLHANATRSDLSVIRMSGQFGRLQSRGGIKLTDQAEIIYQSPTGLFERKVALKDL